MIFTQGLPFAHGVHGEAQAQSLSQGPQGGISCTLHVKIPIALAFTEWQDVRLAEPFQSPVPAATKVLPLLGLKPQTQTVSE